MSRLNDLGTEKRDLGWSKPPGRWLPAVAIFIHSPPARGLGQPALGLGAAG